MKAHLIKAKPNSLSTRWKVWMKEKMLQSLWTHINLTIKPQWAACDAAFSSNTPVFDLLVAFGPCCPFMCYYITHHSGIYIHPSMITSFYICCGLEITPVKTVWLFFESVNILCLDDWVNFWFVSGSKPPYGPVIKRSTVGFGGIWSVFAHCH